MLWTIFIFDKLKRYQRSDIKDNGQRYQLGHCYDVLKTSVSFTYQLKRLYDVLSWLVSLRYQLVNRYGVSNWSTLFTCPWDVAKASQIHLSYWRAIWDVVVMSQYGPRRPNWSVKWVNFFWVLSITFFGISVGSVSLRYELVCRYNISKTPVSFRY